MIKHLISLKVKWYGHILIKTLYEYSVAVLVFGAIFVFGILNPLLISKPIEILLGNNLSTRLTSFYLFILNLIFIILFACQRRMIFNLDFESFIQALPIRKTVDRISSIFVLFISNNFLWIILLLGAYTALSSLPKLMVIVETIYLICSLLLMQLCFYEKNSSKFILLCLSNLAFVFAKNYLSIGWFNVVTVLLTSIISVISLTDIKSITFSVKRGKLNQISPLLKGPVLSVQLAMLRPYRSLLFIKIGFSIVLQLFTALIITHTENPNLIYFMVLFNYGTIWIMSSFSRLMALETKKMADYFSSLSLEKFYWFKKNQTFNLFLTIFMVLPCALFALLSGVLSIWMLVYMIVVITVINASVYYLNLKQVGNTTLILFLIVLLLYAIQFLMR